MSEQLEALVLRNTHRIPVPTGPLGQGATVTGQLDAALLSVGFKLSAELFGHLAQLDAEAVAGTGARTLATVRGLVGDHVRHNSYFVDFPANVPDTAEFWAFCLSRALEEDGGRLLQRLGVGSVNLLDLPDYGRYRHRYEELLAKHAELIAGATDRVTVLHLGGPLRDERTALYLALAGSTTPLGPDGLRDLAVLAPLCTDGPQPDAIPVRENRAVVNRARLHAGSALELDTVTDVLRLACVLSDGDPTLTEPTRLRGLRRPVRRALLAGLDAVVAAEPAKLADVHPHREQFKRLGERLHPHEYPRWPHAARVFAVARGEERAPTLNGRTEALLADGDAGGAARLLATAAPGRLFRALDHLLTACPDEEEREAVLAAAERAAPQVSGRVLLSLREHLLNRTRPDRAKRVFTNRLGRAWVADDHRPGLPETAGDRLAALLDRETRRRLPHPAHLLLDPAVLDVAVPLGGKATSSGVGVLPRGSVSRVEGELLRFFVYWHQARTSTDFDLSALLLDEKYGTLGWLSYTELTSLEGEHSGDVTDARDGASEFINLRLGAVRGTYIVPQVNIYDGEGFEQVKESFFGYMLREAEQQGRPFEARTVRMKSELRGPGRVALPLVFLRDPDGTWWAKWLHLHLKGRPHANQVEGNRVSVATLVRGAVERRYLTVRHLTGLMDAVTTTLWDGATVPDGPVTFVGLERPEGLHPDSTVVTPENLRDLIPA
ncbi:TerD family protein [Kitasatospora albolonga]|uniref:TerD family protein n=1 Tax=Kitasatospora albolonga TaxID=68173 RepID=UPI0031EF55FD